MALTDKENDRLRVFVERLRNERYNGNASDLASALGVSQSLISRFLSGKTGTSEAVALDVATLLGMNVLEVLGRKPGRHESASDPAPVASPAPPPVSETHVTRAAARQMVRAAFRKDEHDIDDATLVEDALLVGAPYMRDLDPTDYVRRLLDTAARHRERGQAIDAKDLHGATMKTVFEESRELRAQLAVLREREARARQWLADNGIDLDAPPPGPGAPLAPTRPTTPRPKSGASRR